MKKLHWKTRLAICLSIGVTITVGITVLIKVLSGTVLFWSWLDVVALGFPVGTGMMIGVILSTLWD